MNNRAASVLLTPVIVLLAEALHVGLVRVHFRSDHHRLAWAQSIRHVFLTVLGRVWRRWYLQSPIIRIALELVVMTQPTVVLVANHSRLLGVAMIILIPTNGAVIVSTC